MRYCALILVLVLGCAAKNQVDKTAEGYYGIGKIEQSVTNANHTNDKVIKNAVGEQKMWAEETQYHIANIWIGLQSMKLQFETQGILLDKLTDRINGFVCSRLGWKNVRDFWWLVGIFATLQVLIVVTGVFGLMGFSKFLAQFLPGSNGAVVVRNWIVDYRKGGQGDGT